MRKIYIVLLLTQIIFHGCKSEYKEGDISYNLEEYDSFPQLFLPWIVNTSAFEMNASFSKSGKKFYYSVADPYQNYNAIVSVKKRKRMWGNPEVVSFSGIYSDFDPFLTHDENRLYFCSRRPLQEGIDKTNDANIWFVQKDNDAWGEPQALNANINSEFDEYYISVSKNGSIYFSSTRPGGVGSWDIYFSQDQDSTVKNIGKPVNSAYREWDPFIAEDESFIIFTSDREGGFGGGDLYISFIDNNGNWETPKNLGEKINTSDYEYCPSITHDMQYLYFSRFGGSSVDYTGSKKSFMQLTNKFKSIENGLGNIYRIKLKDLEVFERE